MNRPARVASLLGAAVVALSPTAATQAAVGPVLVVGDSLSVGTTPYLSQALPGEQVTSDGRIGRPSGEAVAVLRGKLSGSTRIVVFDAGVNDDPAQPGRLAADLEAVRSLVGDRCLVIATVSRPPYRGVTVDGLNRAVRSFAGATPNVQLVDWRAAATSRPELINPDGVHPTPAGYRFRAGLFADAIASCGGGGAGGGSPAEPPSAPGGDAEPAPPARPRKRRPRNPSPDRRPDRPPPTPADSGLQVIEPVGWTSHGTVLAGELLPPEGSRPHPAVVLIPGAGGAGRESVRSAAYALAKSGVTALIYDGRGTGQSGGDASASYAELAADASAGVALLRGRQDVDSDRIGLWGFGQGASVAAIVAARDPRVAAVAAASPSALSPASEQAWQVRGALREADASAGSGPVTSYYRIAAGADGDDLGFDPAAQWRRVAQPVLAVWGGADRTMPARASAQALAAALAGGPNRDRTFRTIPGATHDLAASGPGFVDGSVTWLREHLDGAPPAPTVATPLPAATAPAAQRVEPRSPLDHWPVQLAWLLLPALALAPAAARGLSRHLRDPATKIRPREWWLPAVVLTLDLAALGAIAYAVADIVSVRGRGVEAIAGMPAWILVAWLCAAGGVAATAALTWRGWRRAPARRVAAASVAWLLLAAYWLI